MSLFVDDIIHEDLQEKKHRFDNEANQLDYVISDYVSLFSETIEL